MRWPPTKAAIALGRALIAATVPAMAGSPVRCSTSHGSTIAIDALPNKDAAVAVRYRGRVLLFFMPTSLEP